MKKKSGGLEQRTSQRIIWQDNRGGRTWSVVRMVGADGGTRYPRQATRHTDARPRILGRRAPVLPRNNPFWHLSIGGRTPAPRTAQDYPPIVPARTYTICTIFIPTFTTPTWFGVLNSTLPLAGERVKLNYIFFINFNSSLKKQRGFTERRAILEAGKYFW